MGIPMGMPLFQIKDIIKDTDTTTFSSHFALYRDVSRRVFEVMRTELEQVEQYSVDEAFFILEGTMQEVTRRANTIKDKVEREVGIPVSVGLASSKTQAKYASKLAKKTGVFVLAEDDWTARQKDVQLRELWGVGARTAEDFKRHALATVSDLLALERRQVSQLFGVAGVRLWQELKGESAVVLARSRFAQKSILHSRSFKGTSSDIQVLKDAVAYHLREAAEDLRAMGMKASEMQVMLGTSRHSDYVLQGGSQRVRFTNPTNDTFVLLRVGGELVEALFRPDVPYKKAGVLLFDLVPETVEQLTFFEEKEVVKTKDLSPVIDALNAKVGKGSVLVGTRLKTKDWQSSQALRSPAYTTSWKDIAVVKA
jgi:DNA polymerase V